MSYYDEAYYEEYDYIAEDPECKYCGATDVEWHYTGKRWRLYNEDGSLHVCNPPSADDFEDLT